MYEIAGFLSLLMSARKIVLLVLAGLNNITYTGLISYRLTIFTCLDYFFC